MHTITQSWYTRDVSQCVLKIRATVRLPLVHIYRPERNYAEDAHRVHVRSSCSESTKPLLRSSGFPPGCTHSVPGYTQCWVLHSAGLYTGPTLYISHTPSTLYIGYIGHTYCTAFDCRSQMACSPLERIRMLNGIQCARCVLWCAAGGSYARHCLPHIVLANHTVLAELYRMLRMQGAERLEPTGRNWNSVTEC